MLAERRRRRRRERRDSVDVERRPEQVHAPPLRVTLTAGGIQERREIAGETVLRLPVHDAITAQLALDGAAATDSTQQPAPTSPNLVPSSAQTAKAAA